MIASDMVVLLGCGRLPRSFDTGAAPGVPRGRLTLLR
jgi:hypothetical protein